MAFFGRGKRRASTRRRAVLAGAIAAFVFAPLADGSAETHSRLLKGNYGATYVALGDSYSSGEGLGHYEKGTNEDGTNRNQCHRSTRDAYPVLTSPMVLPHVADRAFFACSGATSEDMKRTPRQTGKDRQIGQPQQTATVAATTRYISLSAGGDDVGFVSLGFSCVEGIIAKIKVVRASKQSCAAQIAESKKQLGTLRKSLRGLYGELLDNAPQATIVVLGYPRVLPASYDRAPKLKGSRFCVLNHYEVHPPPPIPSQLAVTAADIGVPVTDAKAIDAFSRELNATIQGAITDVRRQRPSQESQLRYADSYSSSVPQNCGGHTKGATVGGLKLTLPHVLSQASLADKVTSAIASTLHPTKDGQEMFARVVQKSFTTAPPPVTTTCNLQVPTFGGGGGSVVTARGISCSDAGGILFAYLTGDDTQGFDCQGGAGVLGTCINGNRSFTFGSD
jgi:hypothetical protein